MPKAPSKTSADTSVLSRKLISKSNLQKKLDWPVEGKHAVVCLPMGLTKVLGGEIFENVIDGLLTLPIEILILGKGSSSYGELVKELQEKNEHRIAIIPNDKNEIAEMYLASDMAVFLSDPSDSVELGLCLANGVVPITPETKMLEAYNPVQEKGNSFMYQKQDPWHCFAAIVRALETYIFPFDWKTIQKQCVKSVTEV